jgi:hypothetical protein
MAPPPPPELPEEMQEEILLRFPPDDPARLVQAALVCKPWCRLISGPGFRRRYREFHRTRTPPLLGLFCNTDEPYKPELGTCGPDIFRFVPTSSFTAPRVNSRMCWWWVTDARHGRVLLHRTSEDGVSPTAGCYGLMVWDPTTGEKKELPSPASALTHTNWWTAAVLCDAGGACHHLDCHREPFIVVFVASRDNEGTFISTYSSNAASWSMPIVSTEHSLEACYIPELTHAAHLGNALYFLMTDSFILKYDLELHEMSWIEGPSTSTRCSYVALTTTEGGGLGLAILHESRSRLYMWSWKDAPKADAKWTRSRAIELRRFDADLDYSPKVLGFAVDIGFISVMVDDTLYTIDLKTNKLIRKAKVVATRRRICFVVPYFSFYTPCTPGTTLLRFGFHNILDK